tara:strand:- start:351 stop:818 length:468 start_codon:yes stop_codon:yes gene_type:complete
MFRKTYLLIFITFLLNHCGFTPLYSNKVNNNFSIVDLNMKGDRIINNYIKVNLYQLLNNSNEKQFIINVDTQYNKVILSKDKTAKITEYELISTSIFEVRSKNKFIKRITISEKKNMNNVEDKFEEQKEERIAKQNFASTTSKKLITELSILDDN